MKFIQIISLAFTASLFLASCNDLTELNINPNQLGSDQINTKYVLTSALSQTANNYIREYTYGYTSDHGISEAMQYMQRDYIGYEINSFVWKPLEYTTVQPLIDAQTILENSEKETNEDLKKYYKGVASILRAFWFGFYTSAWGDIPYTEALQGKDQLFKPAYDSQKDIFAGIINELKFANEILTGVPNQTSIGSADLLFNGDTTKWRKLANALRLRYYIRLAQKENDLKASQIDVAAEFREIVQNPSKYPILEANSDNAAISFPGTDANSGWIGGPLANSNRSQFYRRKPCSTIIDFLKNNSDPRLTTWFRPVDAQLKLGGTADNYEKLPSGQIVRYVGTNRASLDTSLYVGLKPALQDPNVYNLGNTSSYSKIGALNNTFYLDQGANPHVSYLADIYGQNTNSLVKSVLMSYAEQNFTISEAIIRGWLQQDASSFYKKGIEASLSQYAISDGAKKVYNQQSHQLDSFHKNDFINQAGLQFEATPAKQLELVMNQKWLALWMTPEFWFDWRRTGLPNFADNIIEGSNGTKIPVRFIYGTREYIVNEEHTRSSVSKLQPSEDTQWSKMWLLQQTNHPW